MRQRLLEAAFEHHIKIRHSRDRFYGRARTLKLLGSLLIWADVVFAAFMAAIFG